MISPVEKNLGYVGRMPPGADDGNAVAFASAAAHDGAAGALVASWTVARRTETGWSLTDANVRTTVNATQTTVMVPTAFSADFSKGLFSTGGWLSDDDVDAANGLDLFEVETGAGTAKLVSHGPTLPDAENVIPQLVWASPDLDHVVFYGQPEASDPGWLAPEAVGTDRALYERIGDTVRVVSFAPGATTAIPLLGQSVLAGARNALTATNQRNVQLPDDGIHAVSDDGRRIFFQGGSNISASPLYLREDGVRTVPVTKSERAATLGTVFNGRLIAADPRGEVAYFLSSTQLTDTAPTGIGIYRYERLAEEGKRLRHIARTVVNPVTPMASKDGKHLYFISTQVLATGGVLNQRNAYHYTNGVFTYIGNVGTTGTFERVSPDGRYALMKSQSSLAGAQTGNFDTIYRYDSVADTVACVSCRADGTASTVAATLEADPASPMEPLWTAPRNLASDGRVFFNTTERLVADDTNDVNDVYEFAAGELHLISSGKSRFASYLTDNSADGTSVFFITGEGLLKRDIDNGVLDLYVARTGGGFPDEPDPPTPCDPLTDMCQGTNVSPFPLPGPGTVGIGPSQNATPDPEPPAPAPTKSVRLGELADDLRETLAKGRAAKIPVTLSGGGKVTVTAKGRIGRRTRTLGSASRTIKQTNAVEMSLSLRLNQTARRELRRKNRLRLTLEVRASGIKKIQRATFTLRKAS